MVHSMASRRSHGPPLAADVIIGGRCALKMPRTNKYGGTMNAQWSPVLTTSCIARRRKERNEYQQALRSLIMITRAEPTVCQCQKQCTAAENFNLCLRDSLFLPTSTCLYKAIAAVH